MTLNSFKCTIRTIGKMQSVDPRTRKVFQVHTMTVIDRKGDSPLGHRWPAHQTKHIVLALFFCQDEERSTWTERQANVYSKRQWTEHSRNSCTTVRAEEVWKYCAAKNAVKIMIGTRSKNYESIVVCCRWGPWHWTKQTEAASALWSKSDPSDSGLRRPRTGEATTASFSWYFLQPLFCVEKHRFVAITTKAADLRTAHGFQTASG